MKTQGKIVILSVALLGAMFLAGLGFLGLLVQTVIDEGAVNDIEGRFLDDEFEAVVTSAELHFEESFENAEIASENSPRERKQSFGGSYEVPDVPVVDGSGEETRSSGDLLSEDGFLGPDEGPDVVSIEMKDTIGKLNDRSSVLGSVGARVREGRPADRMDVPLISHTVSIPVSREGVLVGPSGLDGVEGEFDSIDSDMNGAIGASDDLRAGVSSDEVASTVWTRSNRTTTDSDGDGNPESIYEVKVSVTSTNGTVLNSTLVRVIGMEYIYEDMDSDGFPEHEERSIVRYFNLSIGSRTIAERVAYFNIVKNDTDSNGLVDRIEVRHLSYGYLSIPASVRSVAIAGELILVDGDGDGTFDDREGSAVLFFKKEVGPATVREAALIVSAHVTSSSREMEILRFNRHNSTSGEVLLEEGYVLSYHEGDGGKELLIMAGRNDTVKERVQYVIFNGTKGEDVHVTAFAVENSTIGGVRRSDIVAYDVVFDGEDAAGTLAVGRTDRSNGSLEESFGLVSFERDLEDGVAVYEN
ncbi:MAG: hypothetical protein KAH57_03110, partial [Thermoplasmata archaeon]|nr:hypothetical protein [Thermoplasmata archaeon]